MRTTVNMRTDTALIDHDFVTQLIDAVGVEEYSMLIGSLTHEVDTQVLALDARAAEHDIDGVKQSAHRLAGLLSQFGAFEVARVAEHIWESRSLDEASLLVATMTQLCRRSIAAITELNAA